MEFSGLIGPKANRKEWLVINWEEDWNCINYPLSSWVSHLNVVSDFRYHHSLGIGPIHGVSVGK